MLVHRNNVPGTRDNLPVPVRLITSASAHTHYQNLPMTYPRTVAAFLLVSVVTTGCTDPKMQSKPSNPAVESSTNADGQTDGVVKIAVLTDGTVIVNSETVPIDSLASKLDSIGDIEEIWYHREAPDAAEPHENAMKAIAEIANRKLPIAMYLDRNFTKRATFGE